jgi:hypothetical protein
VELTDEMLDGLIAGGYLLCGNAEEVAQQVEAYKKVGCDQLVFGLPVESMHVDEVYEMMEVFGDHVIPEHDTDPEHRTTKFRRTAKPAFPTFQYPVQDFDIKVLPPIAQMPVHN